MKFLLPNVFGVYLHDTSNRNLFTREKRTLSHGCVRVPRWDAEWLYTQTPVGTPVTVIARSR